MSLPQGWTQGVIPVGEQLEAGMRVAIACARSANRPFGAALVNVTTGQTISGGNTSCADGPLAHAEMNVMRDGLRSFHTLADHVLTSTAEPCPMCATAGIYCGVSAIVFGSSIGTLQDSGFRQVNISAADVVAAAVEFAHPPSVHGGFLRGETDQLYSDFSRTPSTSS